MGLSQQQFFHIEKHGIQRRRNRKKYNQYFTPEFAVEKAISLIPETKVEHIIDPSVGNGVFLKKASEKWKNAKLFGIDIDKDVIVKLKKSNPPNSYFFVGDSLLQGTWQLREIQKVLSDGGFDLVVGNPPFSSWFHRIELKETLSNFELSKYNGNVKNSQASEILFLETFIRIAKNRGIIVIILPDGILANPQYRYVREFILRETKILYVVSLPRNIFEDTSAKTSFLILRKQKVNDLNYKLHISDLDKNGIVNHTITLSGNKLMDRLDYWYYRKLNESCTKHILSKKSVKKLKDFVIYCKTGDTVYGKDRKFTKKGLRFLHSTNISEIGINYKKDEKFIKPKSKMDIGKAHAKVGDILVVRVGNGCVGRTAIVDSRKDTGVVSDCIFMLKLKNISPYFITVFLKTRFGKDWINLQKHGSATTCISQTNILALPVPLLNKRTQKIIEKLYINILKDYRKALKNKTDISGILEKLNLLISFAEKKVEQVTQ